MVDIVGGLTGAASGLVNGLTGGNKSGDSGGTSIEAAISSLEGTFNRATENTAKITEVSTDGNVKKDAAAQRPR